jgi:hypothetical protein
VIKPASVISLAALIAGCSGSMNGVLRGSGEQVSVSSYSGLCLDSLQITLPDGEIFIGYITAPESDGEVDSFCVPRYQKVTSSSSVVSDAHGYENILFSDQLDMMRCDLSFREAGWWSAPGGAGVCTLSDSRIIDVQ